MHLIDVDGSLGRVADEEDHDDGEEQGGHGGVPGVTRAVQQDPGPDQPAGRDKVNIQLALLQWAVRGLAYGDSLNC